MNEEQKDVILDIQADLKEIRKEMEYLKKINDKLGLFAVLAVIALIVMVISFVSMCVPF